MLQKLIKLFLEYYKRFLYIYNIIELNLSSQKHLARFFVNICLLSFLQAVYVFKNRYLCISKGDKADVGPLHDDYL
jgi:hypothetical protein